MIRPDQREFERAVFFANEVRKLDKAAHSARVNGFRAGAGRMYALRRKSEVEVWVIADRAFKEVSA